MCEGRGARRRLEICFASGCCRWVVVVMEMERGMMMGGEGQERRWGFLEGSFFGGRGDRAGPNELGNHITRCFRTDQQQQQQQQHYMGRLRMHLKLKIFLWRQDTHPTTALHSDIAASFRTRIRHSQYLLYLPVSSSLLRERLPTP